MGTLVYDPFSEEIPAFFGMTLQQMLNVKHRSAWVEFELGQRDNASFLKDFFADGRTFDHEGFCTHVKEAYRWIEQMPELLEALAASGVKMHALSNYPEWYRWIEAKLGLSRHLEWSFVSCKTGVRKPDPHAYLGAANTLGVSADRCLFIDDRASNCAAALKAGLDAIEFLGANNLRAQLQLRGLLS